MNARHAAAIAAVRANGSQDGFAGWQRFLGYTPVEPTATQARLLTDAAREHDHTALRMDRLRRAPALHDAVRRFTKIEVDVLGDDPYDIAGQCVLLWAMSKHVSFVDVVLALSIPLYKAGERLLVGCLICDSDPSLGERAQQAVKDAG